MCKIYKITMLTEDRDYGWDYTHEFHTYLMHSNECNDEEFNKICDEAKRICREQFNGTVGDSVMTKVLKNKFRFCELDVLAIHEYKEEY